MRLSDIRPPQDGQMRWSEAPERVEEDFLVVQTWLMCIQDRAKELYCSTRCILSSRKTT